MSSSSRHHWEPHLPGMVAMYKAEKSIPEIRRTLKSKQTSFNVSQKQLYNKFNSLNLPTDKKNGERASTIQALKEGRWKSSIDGVDSFGNLVVEGILWKADDSFPQSFDTRSTITGTALPVRTSPPHNEQVNAPNSYSTHGMNTWVQDCLPNPSQGYPDNDADILHDLSLQTYGPSVIYGEYDGSVIEDSDGNATFSAMDVGLPAVSLYSNDTYVPPSQWQPHHGPENAALPMAVFNSAHKRPISDIDSMTTSIRQKIRPPLSTVAPIPEELVLGSDDKYQPPAKKCFRKHADESIERKHAQMRIIRSATPDQRLSTSTSGSWRDSGYGSSGRATPLISLLEEAAPHKDSLLEFGRLYRLPCQLHGQQPRDDLKEASLCLDCRISGIHHIGWSARHYNLESFKASLKSRPDISATDAVGNSALHYAAAGGAGLEHFSALIDAGVNPYQLNTAGQLFLSYLPSAGLNLVGYQSFELFSMDLVCLLNLFQANGSFRWRDNDGNTVQFDVLVGQIHDQILRGKIFSHLKDAGCSSLFLQSTSASTTNDGYRSQQPQPVVGSANSFQISNERQEKAWEVIGRAVHDPSYVDPNTGDNALLALAQVKLGGKVPGTGSLLPMIRQYIKADVDLNHTNHSKEPPLVAMIRERPWLGIDQEETGATMSKYLDALLWKDPQKKIRNKINVNLKNREGATALYYACILARPDSVRSLVEAGANVNAFLDVHGCHVSILQATRRAQARLQIEAAEKWKLKLYLYVNVISYLEHANAVDNPSPAEERALSPFSVRTMPI